MSHSNKSHKKSPKPFKQHIALGVPTNIALGPLGFRVELDVDPKDGNPGPSRARIVFHDKEEDKDRGLPALKTSSPGVVIDDTKDGNDTTKENTGGTREGKSEPVEAQRVLESDPKDTTFRIPAIHVDVPKEPKSGFGSLEDVLGAISAVYMGHEEVRNKIQDLLSRMGVLEARFTTRPGDVAEQRCRRELIRKFKDIEGRLRSWSERLGPQRSADRVQDDEVVPRLLEDLRETISDYQTVQEMAIYTRGCKMISAAEATVLNNFRCAQEAGYRHGGRKGCLKGTRGAVLDQIELWTRNFDKPSVYWLNGLAGTGKSTIAQTIAERVFADGHLGASFFCSRDFEDRSNLHFIFPTLAIQLARKYTEFRSILVPLAQSDPGIASESLYHQMDRLIVQPLRECAISTVIIVDALDECKDEEPASAILSVLGQFVSQIPKVKFFLTGRPELRIRDGFRLPLLAKAADILVLHKVELDLVNNDIRWFLEHNFLEIVDRRNELGLDDWPTGEQLDLLCKRAAGLFIYAVATVKFIDNPRNNPRKRLDFLLQSPESSTHEGKTKLKANTTLDSLYMTILQEAFDDEDPQSDPRIRSVLGAVILATNPLSPSTIAAFLGLGTGDVFPLLSSFHSLLLLQQDANHPVRPFHKSFPDFLVDPTRCINPRFRVSPPDHHSELVIGCLELMNRMLKKNMFEFPDGFTNDEVDGLRESAERSIDRSLRYACESWHKHLVDANAAPTHTAKITSALHQFLEQKFLFWLEVLSVLGVLRDAVDALEAAGKWLEASPALDLAEAVNDYFRFVTGFFEAISTSAAHIYHSALPLSPQISIVRRLYEAYARPLTRIVRGVPMSWDPVIVAVNCSHSIWHAVWSPCSRFVAIDCCTGIQILDAVTLKRIKSLTVQHGRPLLLAFSADSRLLTRLSDDPEAFITWDVQTGVLTGIIYPEQEEREQHYPGGSFYYQDEEGTEVALSITHSGCGTMFGVLFKRRDVAVIVTYNNLSSTPIGYYPIEMPIADMIWTHDKCIRFATFGLRSITIWEIGFTSEQPATVVESLPTPNNSDPSKEFLFLPTLSRLAFVLENGILVWDAQHSKLLLSSVDIKKPREMTFSSDGHFFAYATGGPEIYLWKDSPTGYTLHQKFIPNAGEGLTFYGPFLSSDGRSILAFSGSILQLWHTTDTLSSASTQVSQNTQPFVLGLSPDESLAAAARLGDNAATVLDLGSGTPLLQIDVGMKIYGLRVAGSTVVVVGEGKIVTWNLPPRDGALNTATNINNSIRTTTFDHSPFLGSPIQPSASISPDFNHIAVAGVILEQSEVLNIYDMTTGKCLAAARSDLSIPDKTSGEHLADNRSAGKVPWFTPGGHEVWSCSVFNFVEGWAIVKDSESDFLKMERIGLTRRLPEGCPWMPRRGYEITDDGWMLDSNGKRLLWLPTHWRLKEMDRIWNGRFLAILHHGLPEAVILEVPE